MSDSISRATGKVFRRAWRQAVYAIFVFIGAWVGQRQGITGVAVGVLGALFINYLLMAQLSLSVLRVPWLVFLRAQLPTLWLTVIVGAVTLGAAMGSRHLGLPLLARLLIGGVAAAAAVTLSAWLVPRIVLGEHGIGMRASLRSYWLNRVVAGRLREPA